MDLGNEGLAVCQDKDLRRFGILEVSTPSEKLLKWESYPNRGGK